MRGIVISLAHVVEFGIAMAEKKGFLERLREIVKRKPKPKPEKKPPEEKPKEEKPKKK